MEEPTQTELDTRRAAYRTGRRNTATQRDTQRAAARTLGPDLSDPFYSIGRNPPPQERSEQMTEIYPQKDTGGGGLGGNAPLAGYIVINGVIYEATINGVIGKEVT